MRHMYVECRLRINKYDTIWIVIDICRDVDIEIRV